MKCGTWRRHAANQIGTFAYYWQLRYFGPEVCKFVCSCVCFQSWHAMANCSMSWKYIFVQARTNNNPIANVDELVRYAINWGGVGRKWRPRTKERSGRGHHDD